MTKLDSALALAKMGLRVFLIHSNSKTPMFKGWQSTATSDLATVKAMWTEHPDANIGVATGAGLMVLDFDVKDGATGLKDLADFKARGLDDRESVRTPTGGIHVYLRVPPGIEIANSVKKIAPGVDVRGDGGYVLGAGSTLNDKAYE